MSSKPRTIRRLTTFVAAVLLLLLGSRTEGSAVPASGAGRQLSNSPVGKRDAIGSTGADAGDDTIRLEERALGTGKVLFVVAATWCVNPADRGEGGSKMRAVLALTRSFPPQISCPGCSYYSSCCCAPMRGPRSTVTRTSWSTKTVTAGGQALRHRRSPGTLKTDYSNLFLQRTVEQLPLEVGDLEDEPAAVSDAEVGAVLQRRQRHLCPACPPGVAVSNQPPSAAGGLKQTSGVQYCCPAQRPVTKLVTRTITRTATRKPGPGAQATHIGVSV